MTQAARQLASQLDEVIADAQLTKKVLAQAVGRGLTDSAGVPMNAGERISGTREPDAAMLRLVEAEDPARKNLSKLSDSIAGARGMISLARSSALALLPIDADKAKELLGTGPVPCLNCGRDVWCTPADRLRKGRCEPCYRHLDRHGIERPQELWKEPEKADKIVANGSS